MRNPRNAVLLGALLCAGTIAASQPAHAAGDVFQITSPAFKDGDVLPATYVFDGLGIDKTPCGGQNQSPPLRWENAPAGTQSFALVVFDPDGFNGLGVTHWVEYNLAPSKTSVAQGEGAPDATMMTSGKHQYGAPGFRGFCPPKGQSLHHYVMTVYALDLPPTLPAGMTRAELLAAIDKHVLRASSIVGRVGR
jgi:Raf kinase inhibitor-like YbhB/YbcL family protein